MLRGLDDVPWANLEHAYGSARDVPDLLRKLQDNDPEVRRKALWALYGNVFHQGTRYPATAHVIPFLIELCANQHIADRGELLRYWGTLITRDFSIQTRPTWGDGERIHVLGEVLSPDAAGYEADAAILHSIYLESIKGCDVVCDLLSDKDDEIRAGAAWVLACLPTLASSTIALLQDRIPVEPSGVVRAAIAFSLGELGVSAPLHSMLSDDPAPATRCMAACELARIAPDAALLEPLLQFVAVQIDEYEDVPGSGGRSTGDAAFSISHLPLESQRSAIVAVCDRLDQARAFDTMPLVSMLLSAAFPERTETVTALDPLQRQVLSRMVNTNDLWSIGNLHWTLKAYGLPFDKVKCSQLIDSAPE